MRDEQNKPLQCRHCDGKGVCIRGANDNSCYNYYEAAEWEDPTYVCETRKGVRVQCSICNGTGWLKRY